ncbi:CPCC family cysteine-rich protein [Brevundimonas sp. GCM10030266]|uniref:CPCC family cysteine-rich protein n=1 Tax=Brevundimonas sp. GCM10030266 TaxID=3273386 RepID=UPI0036147384
MGQALRTTCPCCGYQTLAEGWGSSEVCPICWWEDDGAQLGNPLLRDGANAVSLAEAQIYFITAGVSDPRFSAHVRPPADDLADPAWRPLDGPRDLQGRSVGAPYWLET